MSDYCFQTLRHVVNSAVQEAEEVERSFKSVDSLRVLVKARELQGAVDLMELRIREQPWLTDDAKAK